MTNNELKKKMEDAARVFLENADALNVNVSAYIDGSNDIKDIEAYRKVKSFEDKFTNLYNMYFDEHVESCLNYELAESVL